MLIAGRSAATVETRPAGGEAAVSRIFVSYRRTDDPGYAGRLYDRLADHFGDEQVFMDVDNIEPGVDFVEVIEKTVGNVDALIAVIGPTWLTSTDETGARRLDNPHDFVRLEVANALARNIRVVPVLVRGARMPKADELPDDLKALVRRNALLVTDTGWRAGVDRLVAALERALEASGPPPLTPPPGEQAGPRRHELLEQQSSSPSPARKAGTRGARTLPELKHLAREAGFDADGPPSWSGRLSEIAAALQPRETVETLIGAVDVDYNPSLSGVLALTSRRLVFAVARTIGEGSVLMPYPISITPTTPHPNFSRNRAADVSAGFRTVRLVFSAEEPAVQTFLDAAARGDSSKAPTENPFAYIWRLRGEKLEPDYPEAVLARLPGYLDSSEAVVNLAHVYVAPLKGWRWVHALLALTARRVLVLEHDAPRDGMWRTRAFDLRRFRGAKVRDRDVKWLYQHEGESMSAAGEFSEVKPSARTEEIVEYLNQRSFR